MKSKKEAKTTKTKKAVIAKGAPEPHKSVNEEIRLLLKSGMEKEKIIQKIAAGFVAAGKDEKWAVKRAKNKLAFIVKEKK